MAAFIAKYIGGKLIQDKILKERLENKFGTVDPYFEQVPATRLNGTPNGKFKKVRKAAPPGISAHDAEVLTKVKRRAYRLDMAFGTFLGLKFGWGSVLGLVPIFGDFADAFLAILVIRTAKQIEGGLPAGLKLQMYFWVLVDFIVGLVPFVGDLFDAVILANTRNAAALEEHLREQGKKNMRASGLPLPATDPSDPDEFDRLHSEHPDRSRSSRKTREPARDRSTRRAAPHSGGVAPTQPPLSQPAPARVRDDRPSKSSGGFFGFGRKKARPTDVEAGARPAH